MILRVRPIKLFCLSLCACIGTGVYAFEPLPPSAPAPTDNPMSAAKVELGKQLYFEPRLSKDGTVTCNSCHNVMSGGTDNRAVSVGINGNKSERSTPTIWNTAFLSVLYWDGHAANLEEQAKQPMLNPLEMGMPDANSVVARINAIPGYRYQFNKVFGGEHALSYTNIAKAIAAYERTLITPNSAFDRYLKGDPSALSQKAKRGMRLVQEIGCTSCHAGANFAGPELPSGQGNYQKFPIYTDNEYVKRYRLAEDPGRYTVTRKESDRLMWRVPTLRNILLTAPYFHNGSVNTLDEAVRVMAKTQLNKDLSKRQVSDIVVFLSSLSGEVPVQTMPTLPETPAVSLIYE